MCVHFHFNMKMISMLLGVKPELGAVRGNKEVLGKEPTLKAAYKSTEEMREAFGYRD